MSVIASELPNNLESFLAKVNKENSVEQTTISSSLSGSLGSFFIFEHEPVGSISSSPRYSSNTNAVSIPYSSKYRRSSRIILGSTNSPSPSSLSSATANGSISSQSLKESLNKTISSIIENCQEKVILHNNSPSSSYSFTKHSTIIYSPSKTLSSPLSSSSTKSKLSQDNVLTINKIKPNSLNKESKASEITFGLKKEEILSKLRKSSSDDTNLRKVDIRITKDQLLKNKEMKDEPNDIKIEVKEQTKKEEIQKDEVKIDDHLKEDVKKEDIKRDDHSKDVIKKENSPMEDIKKEIVEEIIKEEVKTNKEEKEKDSIESEKIEKPVELVKVEEDNLKSVKIEVEKSVELNKSKETVKPEVSKVEKKVEKKVKKSEESKVKSLAKLEAKKNKELLQKKKSSHKKTLSLPNILAPLTPLTGIDDISPPPTVRKRRKSVNFSSDSFKTICVFTTTDKPESIRNSKIEVKIDDPESDKKDKEFSELRNYENAWSPVPRNVIHIQKFKSSKARHVQYELPVSIQSFKLVRSNNEETEDKLTCLKVTLNVQNLNYEKRVVIRYTVDKWKSFKEVEAKYVKCIREATKDEGDGVKGVVGLDRFVARIHVGNYFVLEEKPGHICNQRPTKMLLVARYEVNNNTYWDNNDFTDYHIELVRINAGYDVPRVSKHGKPIPCPGCCMDGKQSNSIENTGKEVKNNKRTVRKIGGVFGNFTEAVGKNSDHTNFMVDKEKINLYMGIDGVGNKNSTIIESKKYDSTVKVVKVLTEEPQSIENAETSPKKTIPKKKMNSFEKMMRPDSYGFGCSPSMSGSPMFSMLNSYPINTSSTTTVNTTATTTTTTTTTTNATTTTMTTTTIPSSSSIYSSSSLYGGNITTPSKYDPPMSTTSSLYQNNMTGMGISSSSYGSNSSYSSYDVSSHSKYELSPYNGGISYDPSDYGSTPSSLSYTTGSSKYNPSSEGYSENKISKYDPSSYYSKSFSSPLPSVTSTSNLTSTPSPYEPSPYGSAYSSSSSPSMYDHYDSTNHINTQYGKFSEYNFGTNLKKKAQNNKTQDYSLYGGGRRSSSKYDIPFSTYSSFGDNFSNYYSISPSAVTY